MYSKLIERQRRLNPSRPKLPIPGEFSYKSIDLIHKEVKTQDYKFTGCHYLGAELWLEDNRPLLVGAAEFMRTTNNQWEDRRYLYLPLSRCQDLLPFTRVGDVHLSRRYPTAEDLIIRSTDSYPVVYNASARGSNILLPGFQYTGVVVQNINSTLYKYIDVVGDYSEPGSTYLSPLRPVGLDNPLGDINFNYLIENIAEIGSYPKRLERGWIGEYTGYMVIDILGKKWHQYRDNNRYFLLDSPPDPNSRSYYYYWNRLDNPSIAITARTIDYVQYLQTGEASLTLT